MFSSLSWGAMSSSLDGEVLLVASWWSDEEDESIIKAKAEIVWKSNRRRCRRSAIVRLAGSRPFLDS